MKKLLLGDFAVARGAYLLDILAALVSAKNHRNVIVLLNEVLEHIACILRATWTICQWNIFIQLNVIILFN